MDTLQDEGFDIPDPTDWLGTPLAGLVQVEQAFRCHVCKDFYNSPMITSCNHTFCSLCIRRCLTVDGKCPLCRGNDQESKLRGNWALREAVDAFVKTRDNILRFAKTPAPVATPKSPKRKATDVEGWEEINQETKRTRTSSRRGKAKGAEATTAIMIDEVDSHDPDEPAYEPEPDDGLVACPICMTRMKAWQVDKHLDTSCPGSPQPQPPTSSASRNTSTTGFTSARSTFYSPPKQSKPPERLPTLAYSMLKEKDLRKKMTDLGISAGGTRQMLEKRHQEWITIWNANCDSAHPKRRSELLHDLDVWERTVGSRAPSQSKAAAVGAQIKDKDFDGAAWASKHDSSFKDLIANARKTRSQAQPKKQESSQAEKPEASQAAEKPPAGEREGRKQSFSGSGVMDLNSILSAPGQNPSIPSWDQREHPTAPLGPASAPPPPISYREQEDGSTVGGRSEPVGSTYPPVPPWGQQGGLSTLPGGAPHLFPQTHTNPYGGHTNPYRGENRPQDPNAMSWPYHGQEPYNGYIYPPQN